ncbi:MAG TPA: EamA family transporter RarD [Paracoccaceae bacterium]|nr:EamA family transporter RarD [Paracoccaceae bacterium]HMO72023.1 EamA family transporter RarD [Paracoccaceae bacterium]
MADPAPLPAPRNEDSPRGFAFAFAAYLFWGFLPLYLKLMVHIPPAEVIAHRILWSVPIAGVVLVLIRRTADLRRAMTDPRTLAMAAVTATLLSVNWGIYVWAVMNDRALDTALGYYINPLFSVALGAILLGERMSRLQLVAIGLAALAVAVLTVSAGSLPWVSLALTVSWGLYAYFRKTLPIGPNQGFFLEVAILAPVAAGWILWAEATGQGHFGTPADAVLLIGAGFATAAPLMVYANGAKLLRLSTIGMMQYIAPTIVFLIAVFVFDEPFGQERLVAFALIWVALALYTVEMLRGAGRR